MHVGTVTDGKLADLAIADGDPPAGRIWLGLQLGVPGAGQLPANPAGPGGWPGRG